MKLTITIMALSGAALLLAETGPTATEYHHLAARTGAGISGGTTCRLADGWSCRGTECPTCSVDISGKVDSMGINFPDGKLTCITETFVKVPDNIDLSNPFTLRFDTVRIGGQPGVSEGGVCTSGQCAELQVYAVSFDEITNMNNFMFPVIPGQPYHSDLLPGFGSMGANRYLVGAVRDIPPMDLGLKRHKSMAVKLCRDGRATNERDTQTGVERVRGMHIVWRTVLSPTEEKSKAQEEAERNAAAAAVN